MSGFRVDPNKPHLGGNIPEGDPQTFCPKLWEWIKCMYTLETALDVGCGSGHALHELNRLGYHAIGFDGLQENINDCSKRGDFAFHFDLTTGSVTGAAFDFIWCCEVVEHIEEKYLSNLLLSITGCDILAMTHAVPGQTGHHHVNEQPEEYWIEHVKSYGMDHLPRATKLVRTLDAHENHFSKTGLLFRRAT